MAEPVPPTPSPSRRGPWRAILDLFSSVWLGIGLLALLFGYMAIGSAGVLYPVHPNLFHKEAWAYAQMRQWRPFEMTEFEWFHWWPFDLLMALIAVNIAVTTVRRIPLRPVNFGVWMIHAGVLTLMLGGVVYFATKVEGDALVQRREVLAEVVRAGDDGVERVVDSVRFAASPGARTSVGSAEDRYDLEVVAIDPEWEMRSEDAEGLTAYSVNVQVRRSGGAMDSEGAPATGNFVRQLLAGHPEHTEDVVFTNDRSQPMQRAVKAIGKPLVDESIRLTLDYAPQEWLYLRPDLEKCWALYVRKPGATAWTQRPIEGVPLYNDYVGSRDQVFVVQGAADLSPHPLDVAIPPAADDPFPNVTFRASGYLRYALERTQFRPGGAESPINPVVQLAIEANGQRSPMQLEALNPPANRGDGGLIAAFFAQTEPEFEARTRPPSLRIRIPSLGVDVVEEVNDVALGNPNAPFFAVTQPDGADGVRETGYVYRVVAVQDDLALASGVASVAIVELKTPSGEFRRWVFDDARLTRDATEELMRDPHAAQTIADPTIEIEYAPGLGSAIVALVAGPDPNRLRMVTRLGDTLVPARDVGAGESMTFPAGITLEIANYLPRAVRETKPLVVPESQRDRDAGVQLSQLRVDVPGGSSVWLPFHQYVFDSPLEVPRRHSFAPVTVTLADGQRAEVLFGRQRLPLPTEVALEEFVLTSHIGGFTGEQSAIRDYMSLVRFRDRASGTGSGWTEPVRVSVNKPVEHGGYSFFQAQWDPPDRARREGDRASAGLNYTVLGVGNRNGVGIMLLGCCVACAGMIYAFYVKPIIKRRRREEAMAAVEESKGRMAATSGRAVLVGAAEDDS